MAIGAHPGLPDLQGFGRREIKITPAEAYQFIIHQIGALYGFTRAAKVKLHHVKPHGALYNMAARDKELAHAIVQAVYDFDPTLFLYALAGSEMIDAAEKIGLPIISEAFADRTYQNDGSLTPRNQKNALINDPEHTVKQALLMIKRQQVLSIEQQSISLKVETICIHSDHDNAIKIAEALYHKLTQEKITICAPVLSL